MRRLLFISFLLIHPLAAQSRDEALRLAHQGSQLLSDSPAEAATQFEKAHATLTASDSPSPADLTACAGYAARAHLLADNTAQATTWFHKALETAPRDQAIILRAELADLLMKSGQLDDALDALKPEPESPHAQWHQTEAKVHLSYGNPQLAARSIEKALTALPADDHENRAALFIDQAGITLRSGGDPTTALSQAEAHLKNIKNADPETLSAWYSLAAQAPQLTPSEAFLILSRFDAQTLPPNAHVTWSVTLAQAAARAKKADIVRQTLDSETLSQIPDDHPLLAQALFLLNDPRSSEVAMRWLENSETNNPDFLLGLQRTVDPISPLVDGPVEKLTRVAIQSQNYALRRKLGGKATPPPAGTILYLIYQKNFEDHYGALVFKPQPVWIPLGPTDRIHRRVAAVIDAAERTVAEVPLSVTLDARLIQLHKSVWEPLLPHLSPESPIHIAPAGMLYSVPWAILCSRDGTYLCQKFSQVRILGLTGTLPYQEISPETLFLGVSVKPKSHNLPALPGVPRELSALDEAALLNPKKAKILALLRSSPGTIHLAGHAWVRDTGEPNGFSSGFIFPETTLTAAEIAQLTLKRTSLTVLSACRGGVGRGEISGGWSSLRRAFLAAGSRHVMAAQWRVRDDGLPTFMKTFHQRVRENSPSQALWQLQRELLDPADPISVASIGAWVLECAGH